MKDSSKQRGESGLWFSPQPFHPALHGQRHLDSTLFDVRQIDIARRLARFQAPEPKVQAGSGLIDIPTLVGVNRKCDDHGRAVVVPPPKGLVVPVPVTAMPVPESASTRRLLSLICLLLFVATAMLAIEALR